MTTKHSKSNSSNVCQFHFSDGRRCRMLRRDAHPILCPFHAREEEKASKCEACGDDLAAPLSGDAPNIDDINKALARIFTALAKDRIKPRTATALAYIGQVMLQSVPLEEPVTKIVFDIPRPPRDNPPDSGPSSPLPQNK